MEEVVVLHDWFALEGWGGGVGWGETHYLCASWTLARELLLLLLLRWRRLRYVSAGSLLELVRQGYLPLLGRLGRLVLGAHGRRTLLLLLRAVVMVELLSRAMGLAELKVCGYRRLRVVGRRADVVADGGVARLGGCRVGAVVYWGLVVVGLRLGLLREGEGQRRGSVCVAGGRWREWGRVSGVDRGQRCHGEIGLGAVMGLLLALVKMVGVHFGGMGCTVCWGKRSAAELDGGLVR